MKTSVILSAVGGDRPGLTKGLAEAVFAAGGNWLESHLSRLGGKYVGSILVELDAARLGELGLAVERLNAGGASRRDRSRGRGTGERRHAALVRARRPGSTGHRQTK